MSTDASELLTRLQAHDATLWPDGNVAPTRLGWLDVVDGMRANVAELSAWANSITAKNVVLIGMGGSSLGPEVLHACSGDKRLIVLDTTDPATVAATPTDDTFFVVSSKSGGTLEIRALLAYFWEKVPDSNRYAAVTDPGTELENLARERNFNHVFVNPADIGGRYSVLSYFGLVPAALMGIDIQAVLDSAKSTDQRSAVELGIEMAQAAQQGRDKVTILTDEKFQSFGLWIEQLIAESTGKSGKGCVPIPTIDQEVGTDRFNVTVSPTSVADLGREFLKWEIATAICGHVLDIDPFNEPNVTESKQNTTKVLENLPLPTSSEHEKNAGEVTSWLKEQVRDGDYISIQAYFPFSQQSQLENLRRRVRDSLGGIAVTAGFGPRFLHSTGQLHKGGPNTCVAVQILPTVPTGDAKIPGFDYDFNTLIRAQAEGDLQSLLTHGRRVIRVLVNDLDNIQ